MSRQRLGLCFCVATLLLCSSCYFPSDVYYPEPPSNPSPDASPPPAPAPTPSPDPFAGIDYSIYEPSNKWAVIVGINEYFSEEVHDLGGCLNDALEIKGILTEKFGFYESNIRFLTDGSASRENILSALGDWLFENVSNGDLVIFFYSGHGSYTSDFDGDEEDGFDETICPSDRDSDDGSGNLVYDIRDDELKIAIERIVSKGATITIILDSCHSGTGVRDMGQSGTAHIRFAPPISDGKKLPLSGSPRGIRSGDEELAQKGVTLIAACLAEESSHEYIIGDEYHGLLTYFLVKALEGIADENQDNLLSYQEVWQYTRSKVTHYIENHHPEETQNVQLECSNPENPVFQPGFISGDYSRELILKGAVVDGQGRRVNRALVGILPQGTASISRETLIAYGRTDESGFFTANNKIKAGRYTVKVVADGYATLWQEVEIQESQGSGVAYLKITLTKK